MVAHLVIESDIVIAILSLLGEGKSIPADKNFLYDKFFELSKEFPQLFNSFIFDESKIHPRCETVDIAIDRIVGGWKMVEWKNLGDDYVILPALVEKGKKVIELFFGAAEMDQLSKAAQKFSEMISKKCS